MTPHYPRPTTLDSIKLDRHAIIEASAGTGKTFTIEHLVIDILLREPVTIEEILVLTFTERAAEELRQRLRAKIEDVLSNPCLDSRCNHLKERNVWEIDSASRRRLTRALNAFDSASIGTIHGFFGRVLAEHAFAGGRPFVGELADGRALFGRAFKTALRRALALRPGDSAELLAVWLERTPGEALDELERLLYKCHTSRRRVEPLFSLEDLRRAIEKNPLFELDIGANAAAFLMALKDAKVHHATLKSIRERLLPNLQQAINQSGKSVGALLAPEVTEAIQKIGDCAKAKLTSGAGGPLGDGIMRLRKVITPLRAAVIQLALPRVREFLSRAKAETGQFDYDDLIARVVDALDGPHADSLIAALRRRYRFALVDEFQDTDELQWRFFDRVFVQSHGGHRAYLIGDPKQAIYGFRGGDVEAYLQARQQLEIQKSPKVALADNYRSTALLVEAYNQIFDQSAEAPFFDGGITYSQPVKAGREYTAEEPQGRSSPPIYLLKIEPKRENLAMPELRRGLARQIAREIRKLLDADRPGLYFGRPGETQRIAAKDIFVLTVTNRNAAEVSRELLQADIPFSFYKQDGLFQTSEAHDVRDLLAAIEEPDDRAAVRRAWITPFFEVPLRGLPQLDDVSDSNPLLGRLTHWGDLAQRRRFESLFTSILDDSGIIRRELFASDSERALTNYLHVFEILLEQARSSGCDLAQLVMTLTAYIQGTSKPPGEDSDVQRLESDRDAVQIMTIHKSKGLEAPVVFVYGGFGASPASDGFEYHDAEGCRVLHLGTDEDAKAKAATEADQEQQRLYYVALTRAKARLYLPFVARDLWDVRWKGGYRRVNDRLNLLESQLDRNAFERYFRVVRFKDWPLGSAPEDRSEPTMDLSGWRPRQALRSDADGSRSFETLRRSHAGYEVTSYSRMKRHWETELLLDGQEREHETAVVIPPAGTLPGGTNTGTFLHQILELVPLDSLSRASTSDEWLELEAVAAVVDDALRDNGIDRAFRAAAAQMAYHALQRPIVMETGRSIPGLGLCANTLREMEFLFPLPEQSHPRLDAPKTRRDKLVIERGFIKGFVDLVVEHDGLVYFADWKSDVLESYDPGHLAQHVKKHYDLQAKLYSLALVKALGVHSEGQYGTRFGGLVYVFLRGLPHADSDRPPVYCARPAWSDILSYEKEIIGQSTASREVRS
jgi:exodeoxyribonuclease V beta subunit